MKSLFVSLGLAFVLAAPLGAETQPKSNTYPSRPITLVVPSAAGGPTDAVARTVAEHMRASLGQPVIVENVTGAAGNLAAARVARAVPDGYTAMVGQTSTHVFNGAIYTLPYDIVTDFEPVALLATNPQMIIAQKKVPANNLRELVMWLKGNPNTATMATIGPGSPAHIAGILFEQMTGTQLRFIPYRGGAPGLQDLLAGQIDLMIPQPSLALPHLRADKIKAFVVLADRRLTAAPDIPSTDEAGLPGLHVDIWQGLWAPKGTPEPIVRKLNSAVVAALADPDLRRRFATMAHEIPPHEQQTPAALAAHQRAEIAKWWPVIKAAHIKAE
jgi:tripartite-type tricarboxylate transporter receptor subunit TctC